MVSLADYQIVRSNGAPRTAPSSKLYSYVMAGNGLFVEAKREGLAASFTIAEAEVRGLPHLDEKVTLEYPRVSVEMVSRILNRSRAACVERGEPREILFYLRFNKRLGGWVLHEPKQIATGSSVHPEDETDPEYQQALIELHSHHQMDGFWSGQDNADEQGFRLYAVVGRIFTHPQLRVRVGCYGYFYEVPASEIFELPDGIVDCGEGR